MNLYFNGCSFTYGDELDNPARDSWPTLVASSLSSEFLNNAVSGGTNQQTVYQTIQHSNNYDFFFIAWTFYSRFTEYNPVDNFEINFNPQLAINAKMHYSDDLKKNYAKFETYGKLYYTHWFNELYEFKKWLQQIILLQSFLKVNQKKCIMLNTTDNNLSLWLKPENEFIQATKKLIPFFDYINDDQLLTEHYQIQQLVAMIDQSTFLGWNNWNMQGLTSQYPTGANGHLLKDGHVAIANTVLDYFYNL